MHSGSRKKHSHAWLWLALLALGGCRPEAGEKAAVLAATKPGRTGWAITNQGRREAVFTLDINGGFWASTAEIAARLRQESADDRAFVRNSLEYVHRLSRNAPPISAERWLHSPEVLLNSLGKGFCDDRAASLCRIWQRAGLPARMWNLEGHAVPEVKLGGRWQMFDPETGAFLLKDSTVVCSVEEIAGGQARFFSLGGQVFPITPEKGVLLFLDKFMSREDNRLSGWYLSGSFIPDTAFVLPPGARLSCCRSVGQGQRYASVQLPPHSEGRLHIPLVLAEAPEGLKSVFPRNDSLYSEADIHNPTADTLSVFYYVNPFLPGLQEQNRFTLSGLRTEQLALSLFPLGGPAPPPPLTLDDLRRRLLQSDELEAFVHGVLPRLPKLDGLDGLPDFFHAYLLLKNTPPAELEQRRKAFQERFSVADQVIRQHPDVEERIIRNPVFLLLALEYFSRDIGLSELAAFLESLAL